jgi:hypothetical protein
MFTFVQKQKPTQKEKSGSSTRPNRAFATQSREVSSIVQLQRSISNQSKHPLAPAIHTYQQPDGSSGVQQQVEKESMLLEAEAFMATTVPALSAYQDPKASPAKPVVPTCKGRFLLMLGTAGPVTFPTVANQQLLRAGKIVMKGGKIDQKATQPGASYSGVANLTPANCGNLEFVQNVESHRVITFKDSSKLEKKTSMVLDTSDPYPTFIMKGLSKGSMKAVSTNDNPGQGSSGAFGFIDSMMVNDKFELFLMLKQKSARTTLGLAEWNWNAKAVTTNKSAGNTTAPLKFSGGSVNAAKGIKSAKKPKLSPNITASTFKVVGAGKGQTLASVLQKLF